MKFSLNIKFKYFFGLMLALSLLFTQTAEAVSVHSIYIDAIPMNPKPGESVTVSVSSFAANLDIVNISWFLNDSLVLSGIGKKSYTLNAGSSGTRNKVSAKIFLPDGEVEKTIFLSPSNMTLLWEAKDSYVPPFYKGKAMPSIGSPVKVVAMPEIKSGNSTINPKNISYSWKLNYDNEQTASGYGKNYFIYTGDILDKSNVVSVDALTLDQRNSAFQEITIGSVTPEIVFYNRNNDLGTIWDNALLDNAFIKGQAIIVASPYFVSPENTDRPELFWKWYINNDMVLPKTYRKDMMPVEVTGGESGTSKIRLELENTAKFLPTFNKEILISF